MLPELQHRAEAGDARAACRLSIELIRCQLALSMMDSIAERMRDAKDQANGAPLQGAVLDALDRQSRTAEQCTGLDSNAIAQAPRFLRQAALAGENDAVILYADGAGFDRDHPYRMLADPSFDAWRREAPSLVRRALERGSPDAVYLLMLAYSHDQSLFAGLLANDPVQAEAYTTLTYLLRGGVYVSKNSSLSVMQRQTAQQEAQMMFRDYFGSRTYPDSRRFTRALMTIVPIEEASGSDHAACDPNP